jgi:hypothetical protein
MVNKTPVSITYTSDGVTLTWAFPYYTITPNTDIMVQTLNNGTGVTTNLVLNTDYLWSGTQDTYGAYPENTANLMLVFQPGRVPAAGLDIIVTRKTNPIQPDTYPDNNPFPATINEHDLDRLTLICQELGATGFLGVLPGPPAHGDEGDWFILRPFQPGGAFGMCCVQTGDPGIWNPFATISL